MEYNFRAIEKRWQQQWTESKVYQVPNTSDKPKYYVLDMFPYPSGAGLHVGHPLGYIASDIFARYKRLKGFNVLHPMGYDAFGLPAEQYAIEHGVHPAVSTAKNIKTFRGQLDKIGFCFDWSREVNTSDPKYYKWTQWIFLQLFKSWYNRKANKTEPIDGLIKVFEAEGNTNHPIPDTQFQIPNFKSQTCNFTAADWKGFDEKTKQTILMEYRVAYCGYGEVNWCEALGTVLANDEVVNGVSERGGYPVVKKKLRQWYLRITEYGDRLLEGLQRVDFSEAMKEMQSNWIGKSSGAEITFSIHNSPFTIDVYTTRPDTIFGVDFMVVAPEHELVEQIASAEQKAAVEEYIAYVKSRSERERMAEKKISGVFTGAYAVHPFSGREIPIWISEYVLAGYGTGAIMAVPSGDERDHKFAQYFNIPITNIFGEAYTGEDAVTSKDLVLHQSAFLDGLTYKEATEKVISKLEEMGIGKRKVNFKIRDAAFSRQRYWGEPFPIKWIDGVAYPLDESELPLELPHVESYKPGPEGEGPLANIPEWTAQQLETNTMPGYAGSSWYFLRYMDPHNEATFSDKNISAYWNQVDLYVGGTEHAVGHLLYSRMWVKAMYDLGFITFDEPYKKLLNQGMIQGSSRFVYRVRGTNKYVSAGLKDQYETDDLHVDVNMVDGVDLDVDAFKKWKPDFADAEFILEDGKYICGVEVEKMSKSKVNTVNPDNIVEKYGADTFRMYEMFLGPVEMSKPWDTKGIEGVHRFLKKLWRLFANENGLVVTNDKATPEEWKVLHKTIKKIEEDTERFSFNTAVSAFMVCVNELQDLKCNKREVLEPMLILLTPYAPHIAEELWHQLGNTTTILDAAYPKFEAQYLVESTKDYPVSINGKMRTQITIDLNATQDQVQEIVLANEIVQKWMEGKPLKKFIFVKGKMVNVVV
ncbi:leucine--tRNA ligase [Flavisolibacter tropicus]|uniref:Leucine--tRNA ligase n=1 Tax=Flavisolibacter tropicus TaxID=1492898 RepID=A0A172TZ49_9BACT|nr:leucine--tRNA ligase [Flavisolibacter tropicus]ANE52330.1 leucyl-tRNA synthetase [Flavisolibacter tropicus]